jgi:hypothetical protein
MKAAERAANDTASARAAVEKRLLVFIDYSPEFGAANASVGELTTASRRGQPP